MDTHTHIHEADFPLDIRETLARSAAANVRKMVLVGTSVQSSRAAVDFAKKWNGTDKIEMRATVGIHPHEADPELGLDFAKSVKELENLVRENAENIVAIGEIGLDYFYDFAFRKRQKMLLRAQLELAKKFNLPVNFHIRDPKNVAEVREKNLDFTSVWQDFWPIYDEFFDDDFSRNIFHSYTEQNRENLKIALAKNLNFGVNGIETFAKKDEKNLWREIPLSRIVLETDAPFLSPKGFRGTPNEPAHVREIAENLAELREKTVEEIAKITTENAQKIYNF